ncbi:unnamed protein product [Brassica rapa subsp. trilocularis]
MILTKNKGVIAVQDIAASTTTNRTKGIGASELEVSQVRGVQHSDTAEYGEPVVCPSVNRYFTCRRRRRRRRIYTIFRLR